jgi:hypothetical protein
MRRLPVRAFLVVAATVVSVAAQQVPKLARPTQVLIVTGPNMTALYHRELCPWLKNGGGLVSMKIDDARQRYFQPHCLCIAGHEGVPPCDQRVSQSVATPATIVPSPNSVAAPAAAIATPPRLPTPSVAADAEETVYVTRTGAKYHRAGCRSLARSRIPMSLKEAAGRYGPCSICRPPLLQ